jgi:hypothetical protein
MAFAAGLGKGKLTLKCYGAAIVIKIILCYYWYS